ncbi:hypothetical protein OQJ65_17175 [Vibrio sp. Sgm 22]|uniref:hypothetical protein n=1 Tax=unclassified Vibrio TaxID=2614977 RepID=UPI0022498854|nr:MULTISPECIES: hypothetical protein [unclassified Vibrio]MCX2777056.1 hypothetical protein [Vibrio sp. Sgm 22]
MAPINAKIGELLDIEPPATQQEPSIHVFYAVKRYIDSVWKCAYVITGESKVKVVSFGRNINAGYKYEGSLPALETVEAEDGSRILT